MIEKGSFYLVYINQQPIIMHGLHLDMSFKKYVEMSEEERIPFVDIADNFYSLPKKDIKQLRFQELYRIKKLELESEGYN